LIKKILILMLNFNKILTIIIVVFIVGLTSCSRDERSRQEVLMEAGHASFESGRYNDAMQAWNGALDLDPDNPDILILLAKTHQRLAQFELSTKLLRRVAETNDKPVDAYFMIAQNHILVGDFESAQAACSRLETMMTPDYRLIMLKGDIASFMGRYQEGELLYLQAIGTDSNQSDAYFKMAANLLAQEQEKRADDYYHQGVDIGDPSTVQYWLHRAESQALKGNAGNAEAAMKRALAIQPDDLFIQLKVAQLLLAFKKYEELLQLLGEPVDFATENPGIQKIIVEALLNTNRLEQAHTLLQHHRLSSDAEWMLLLGKYSLLRGALTSAVSHFERALEKRKDDPNAYYLLASGLCGRRQNQPCQPDLDSPPDHFPGDD
jgi:tetratricopeptide (TPR) repeat protein